MRFIILFLALAKMWSADGDISPKKSVGIEPVGDGVVVDLYPEELRGAWWRKEMQPDEPHLPCLIVTERSMGSVVRDRKSDNYGRTLFPGVQRFPDVIKVLRSPDGSLISCTVTSYNARSRTQKISTVEIMTYEPPNAVLSKVVHPNGVDRPDRHGTEYWIR